MDSYKFIFIQEEGEKYYIVPKAVIEKEYGLPEKNSYVFFAVGNKNSRIIHLKDHPLSKKRKDSRLAI